MTGRFLVALTLCAGIASVRAADPPRLLDAPVVLGAARVGELPSEPNDSPIRPVSARDDDDRPRSKPVILGRPKDSRPLAVDDLRRVELRDEPEPVRRRTDDYEDFSTRRSPLSRERDDKRSRSSGKFGDKLHDWFAPGDTWLYSDHAFDQFATPISNPFLAEDPRALTEVRPIFLYQKIPSEQPNFKGGNVFFFGARGSIAFTERFSITINKLGALGFDPSDPAYGDNEFGFAEFWFGPKFTFYRDPQSCTLAAGGIIFQIPSGPTAIFQDTGNLSIVPYLSVGKTIKELGEYGSFNGILNMGYAIAGNEQRSDYFYTTAHLDFDVRNNHRFYPVMELNWFQYTNDGARRAVSGEGHDLFNFGSQANSASLVTGAIGARYKITEAAQIGGAFELPLLGNRDVFQYRFTLDVIFRY